MASLAVLRDEMEDRLRERYGAAVHGGGSARLPNTSFVTLPGREGRQLVAALDARGISVSTGSACHSGEGAQPAVLGEMGVDSGAGGALRISLGRESGKEHVEAFLAALADAVAAARG